MTRCERVFAECLMQLDAEAEVAPGLLIGFSGGVDSTVLLHLAVHHAPNRVKAVHINHGYHPLAADWQLHCQQVCAEFGVGLETVALEPSSGAFREAQARRARYQAFARLLTNSDVLLLAHHLDDASESVLLHQLQGRGSYAMPARRPFAAGQLVRPLLGLRRAELIDFARQRGLSWLDDPGNADLQHDRNFLRHEILPRLETRFGPVATRLAQVGEQLGVMENLLIEQFDLHRGRLPLALLRDHDVERQRLLIRLWLLAGHHSQPSAAGLGEFLRQLSCCEHDRQPQLRFAERVLRCYDDQLWNLSSQPPELDSRPLAAGQLLQLSQGLLRSERRAGGMRADGPLTVHFWQGGNPECPKTLLRNGHHQRIKELMRSARIPPWRRCGYPIVCDQRGVLSIPDVAERDNVPASGDGIQLVWTPHR